MAHRIPAPIRTLIALSLLSAFLVAPEVVTPAEACASNHGRPYLTDFTGQTTTPGVSVASDFYAAAENVGPATATIAVTPGHCTGGGGSALYRTVNGTAEAPSDYTAINGQTPFLCADLDQQGAFCGSDPPEHEVDIQIENDTADGDAVESFRFDLTQGIPELFAPTSAPVHIVDVDGVDRVSLEPTLAGGDAVEYQEQEFGSVRIPVFWAGPGAPDPVHYNLVPDPAAPADPDDDFIVASSNPLPATAFNGRLAFIRIDIVGDRLAEDSESFAITLEADPAYQVAEPFTTTFKILDNEESLNPVSQFHHPRQGLKYRRGDFRIREMHTFARDFGISGLDVVQIAVRMLKANAACRWWNGGRFVAGPCGKRKWLDMYFISPWDDFRDLYGLNFPALKPTGNKIRNYRAWTRAVDRAGNVEHDFDVGRNLSTFRIRRR